MKTSVVMVAVEVVDLDGVLDADGGDDAKGAMGFSCQKILDFLMPEDTGLSHARRYWTCSMPGSLPKGLDLIGGHPELLPLLPPPHPSVSQRFLSYIMTGWTGGSRLPYMGPAARPLLLASASCTGHLFWSAFSTEGSQLGHQGSRTYFGCKNHCTSC